MLLDLLQKRYSCRSFLEKAVSPEIIRYLLECGRLSPSGGNEQPWVFGVVTDKGMIEKIAEAASVNYPQKWIATAPLLIVLCSKLFDAQGEHVGMHRFPSIDDDIQAMPPAVYARVNMEEHQTKIAGEHMVIAALEHGVYSTWVSSLDCERVSELLGLNDYLVTNVLAFGYPAREGKQQRKKELEDITFTNRFENRGIDEQNIITL